MFHQGRNTTLLARLLLMGLRQIRFFLLILKAISNGLIGPETHFPLQNSHLQNFMKIIAVYIIALITLQGERKCEI